MTEENEVQSSTRSRRALLGLGAVASVAVLAAAPAPAKADLSDGDFFNGIGDLLSVLNPIKDLLGSINGILGTAFSLVASLTIPTSFKELIQCLGFGGGVNFNFDGCSALRDYLGGRFQMLNTRQISTTMEDVWHLDPEMTPTAMDTKTKDAFDATFAQVQASQGITASLAEAQAMHNLEDEATLLAIQGAAAAGQNPVATLGSIVTIQALQAQLLFSIANRLGEIIISKNASQQTRGTSAMTSAHDRMLMVKARESWRPSSLTIPAPQSIGTGTGG